MATNPRSRNRKNLRRNWDRTPTHTDADGSGAAVEAGLGDVEGVEVLAEDDQRGLSGLGDLLEQALKL